MVEANKGFDRAQALEAAERIVGYADNNVAMFDAYCDETPQGALDILDAARKLRDLLGGGQ